MADEKATAADTAGQFEVSVTTLSSKVKMVKGKTVGDAIAAAKIDPKGFKVTLNGEEADLKETLRNNDVIVLVPKMVGGRTVR